MSFTVKNLLVRFPEYSITSDEFVIQAGEFFSIDAPSGFGKTTLLRALLGFQKIERGEIHLNGRELQKLPPHERGFGVVFQDHLLFPNLTAWENAVFGLKLRGTLDAKAIERVKAGFASLNLTSRMHGRVHELSGGERQRVALLRATLFRPACLVLDEPLKGLDATSTELVVKFLQIWIMENPVPVIWVSHQLTEGFRGGRIVGTNRTGIRHFAIDR